MKINQKAQHPMPDLELIRVEFGARILEVVLASGNNAGFDDVRAGVVALNLEDSKGAAVTADRLPDGVIHQVCINNEIEVSL